MEVTILNKSFEIFYLLEVFKSLILTERYASCGDFELYTLATTELMSVMKRGYYVSIKDSDRLMIIEDVQIKTEEAGNFLIVTGRSLESLLDRRIVWSTTKLNGEIQNGIKKLLDQNIIHPKIKERRFSNFSFKETNDETISSINVSCQVTGDSLYEFIRELCQANGLGFKVSYIRNQFDYDHLVDENGELLIDEDGGCLLTWSPGHMEFSLYSGVNRSYDQTENAYVVFSPTYNNIINSDYLESDKNYKNLTLVAGEDDGLKRRRRVYGDKDISGIERRELYTDARDLQSETEDGEKLTNSEYNALLEQRGQEKLAETGIVTAFEYGLDPSRTYVYKTDYDNGDLVQVVNEYGIEAKARITEIIRSYDENGFYVYPTIGDVDSQSSYSGSSDPTYSEASFNGTIIEQIQRARMEGVPAGGQTGQVLQKVSDIDYDYRWMNVDAGPSGEGGSSGIVDYNDLINKPQIEGVTLIGNKMFPELNLDVLSNLELEALLN